jgi:hypothetical protein
MARELARGIPDERYPQMWRVRTPDGTLSDMLNLPRARDAASPAAAMRQIEPGLTASLHRPLITPTAFRPEFGNDIPTGSLFYNTFLPSLRQTADSRAFEPVVLLIIELPSGDADSP